MKLYIYEHCPYCVRPRIVSGLKSLDLPLVYLANDDEASHLNRIGKKQVPFLEKDDGNYLLESLAICQYIDQLNNKPILANKSHDTHLIKLVNELSNASKALVFPRFLSHPLNQQDFPTQSAKDYFTTKKESYIGCFKANLRFPDKSIQTAQALLGDIDFLMSSLFATSHLPSWDDIYIFPILRNLTIISDLITIPKNVQKYINHLAQETGIALYQS